MPSIALEVNPSGPSGMGPTYSTLVWMPEAAAVVNGWTDHIDATNGDWRYTGAAGAESGCTQATYCTLRQAKDAFRDATLSVAVSKGRDHSWQGAVDGLRIDDTVYDFEETGVFARAPPGPDSGAPCARRYTACSRPIVAAVHSAPSATYGDRAGRGP
jgi:hypothetical protein